jgi:hypothetical protein
MAKTPLSARGKVVAGKVSLDAPDLYKAALNRWEGRIILTISEEPTTRSAKANAFYWLFLGRWAAVTETGYHADELHEIEKYRHNGKVMEIDGEEVKVGQSTTKLSVQDFSAYIERVMVDAATWDGFFLEPTPAEDWRA